MKDLRNLLIDCRIELRKAQRDFQKTELCERLDLAIQSAVNAQEPQDIALETPAEGVAHQGDKAQTVSQVALAWQTAARDLKFSDPAIHARLSDKVMRLLGAKTLVDPSTELVQLERQVGEQQRQLEEQQQRYAQLESERDTLLGALASAVPTLKDGGDRLAVALARIAWLKSEAEKAAPTPGAAAAVRPSAADPMPSPEHLAAVAARAAALSKEQREWCVGEAMVLSGFRYTPVELIEQGDAAIAQLIIDSRKGS